MYFDAYKILLFAYQKKKKSVGLFIIQVMPLVRKCLLADVYSADVLRAVFFWIHVLYLGRTLFGCISWVVTYKSSSHMLLDR